MNKIKYIATSVYIIILAVPVFTILNNTGSINNILDATKSIESLSYLLLRTAALLGITLMFTQVILGVFMNFWRKVFGFKILKFHIIQGIIAYLIILSHPFFYFIFNNNNLNVLIPRFNSDLEILISLGKIAIILFSIAIFAAIFRTRKFIIKRWRTFHKLNYVVFGLVLIHSYFVGSDSRTIPFVFLYPIFISGLITSVVYKFKR